MEGHQPDITSAGLQAVLEIFLLYTFFFSFLDYFKRIFVFLCIIRKKKLELSPFFNTKQRETMRCTAARPRSDPHSGPGGGGVLAGPAPGPICPGATACAVPESAAAGGCETQHGEKENTPSKSIHEMFKNRRS